MFDLKIISDRRIIYDDTALSVTMDGESSEYEFLTFHADTMGVLRQGNIVIDNKFKIPIQNGIVSFWDNHCTIIVEEIVG